MEGASLTGQLGLLAVGRERLSNRNGVLTHLR